MFDEEFVNDYRLSGCLANNGKVVWVDFPINIDDFKKACESIGLNYDYDDIRFYRWMQSRNILYLFDDEDIERLNDLVGDIQALHHKQFMKTLAIIDAVGVMTTQEAEDWGLDLDMYDFFEGQHLDADKIEDDECNTPYGAIRCNY